MPTSLPADPPVSRLATGWIKLSLDFGRAATAALGGCQGLLLWAVIERAWLRPLLDHRPGDPEPAPVPIALNCTELARELGLDPSQLRHAKRDLLAAGMIREAGGGIVPELQYTRWADVPFLARGNVLAYCRAGAAVLSAAAPALAALPPDPAPSAAAPPASPPDAKPAPLPAPAPAPAPPPAPALALAIAAADPDPPESSPAVPTGPAYAAKSPFARPDPSDGRFPGAIEPDEAALDRLSAWINRWYPMLELERHCHLHARVFPADWMFRAVKRCKARGTTRPGWALIRSILMAWLAAGEPDHREEDLYDDDMNLLATPAIPPVPVPAAPTLASRPRRPEPRLLPLPPEETPEERAMRLATRARRERAATGTTGRGMPADFDRLFGNGSGIGGRP